MRNEFSVTLLSQAAFLRYLGYQILKCEVNGSDHKWLFEIPRFDAGIVLEEYASDKTQIFLKAFVQAESDVRGFANNAKTGMGIWTSARYREMR